MGRPPKPTALKLLQNTARPDRINPNEPTPPDGEAKPPSWLSKQSRVHWRKIAPILSDMGVLTVADQTALALLCDALAEYVTARKVIDKNGATYECETHGGGVMVRQRPEVAIAADAYRRASAMLSQFGLTPSSRTKVTAKETPKADPFTEWMNSGRHSG